MPEKRAENCSKTDGSTRTAPIQHPLIYIKRKASKSTIPHKTVYKSYERFSYKTELFNYEIGRFKLAASRRFFWYASKSFKASFRVSAMPEVMQSEIYEKT